MRNLNEWKRGCALVALLLLLAGCATRGLDPAGPYRGDALLWRADGVILEVNAAYNDLEALAARNPGFFATHPEAQAIVTRIARERDGVPGPGEVLPTLISVRDTYSLYRGAPEASDLEKQLVLARMVLIQLGSLLTQAQPP